MKRAIKARIVFSIAIVVLVSVITSFLMFAKPTYASTNSTAKKWFLGGYHNCIIFLAADTLPTSNDEKLENLIFPETGNGLPHPSHNYLGLGPQNIITCADVLEGKNTGGYAGVFKEVGLDPKATMSESANKSGQIMRLGYNSDGGRNKVVFVTGAQSWANEKAFEDRVATRAPYLIVTPESNGAKFALYEDENNDDDDTDGDLELKLNGSHLTGYWEPHKNGCAFVSGGKRVYSIGKKDIDIDLSTIYGRDGSRKTVTNGLEASEAINNQLKSLNTEQVCSTSAYIALVYNAGETSFSVTQYVESKAVTASGYSLGDRGEAAKRAIESLAGKSDDPENDPLKNIRLDDDEQYEMYYYYLKSSITNWGDDPLGSGALTCTPGSESDVEIHLKSNDNQWHKYYLRNPDYRLKYKTMEVNGNSVSFVDKSLQDIINWMNNHIIADEECPNPAGALSANENGKSGEEECFSNADSLGWIVCPIIKGAAAAIDNIYDSIIEPFLAINVSAFNQGDGAYQAWQFFQSIANIIFVILFLVVIISQITGIGIDNLGIKRILPKLIIAAILVNLSYIICMLLVDISNIAGYGFNRFFDSISIQGTQGGATGGTVIGNLLTGLGLVGGVAALVWVPGAVPAILLGLLSLLVGILTMFVILGVYQAGIIIAVVVSPIAFVLYMLPNTKPIFDRWRKIFQALLLLYPLCGLMMGGAAFAGKVIQSVSDGFWFSLLGALLAVIPFFFIPTLLKSSMSAMGNIGNKISGLGKGLGSKATGAISNSESYKDMMARRAAGVDRNGNRTARGKLMNRMAFKDGKPREGAIGRAARRRAARSEAAFLKREKELGNYNPDSLANGMVALEQERLNNQVTTAESSLKNSEDFKSGDFDKMGEDMVRLMENDQHGENAVMIRAYQNALNAVGEDGRAAMSKAFEKSGIDFSKGPGEGGVSKEARQAFSRNLMENHAADFKNNHRSLFDMAKMNNGETGKGKYTDFVAGGSEAADMKSYRPEQFANMDDEEFKRIVSEYNMLANKPEKSLNDDEKERLATMRTHAKDVLTNDNLKSGLKGSRKKDLETMWQENDGDWKEGESANIKKLPVDDDNQ